MKKIILLIFFIVLIIFVIDMPNNKTENSEKTDNQENLLLESIQNKYNTYVKTNKKTALYKFENNQYKKIGIVNSNISLTLEKIDEVSISDKYFKLDNLDYYIYYDDVSKIDDIDMKNEYKNYIYFNENIVTSDITNFYNDNGLVYSIDKSFDLPILIKDNNKKYVIYDEQLLYVKDEDIKEVKNNINTNQEISNGIRVMTYHQFYSIKQGERCSSIICHEVDTFEQQMKYLYDNQFYTVDMKTLEMFIDGKIRLPKKSIVITIDDGGNHIIKYAYPILEKYKIHATLFLITGTYNANDYIEANVELHSHTDQMHNTGVCPGGQGSPLKCFNKTLLLEDLKKSREKLNNTTIFCYPFYEYNDYAIEVLKEAGFTMAFANVGYKIKPGDDKLKLSRYTVLSTSTFNEYVNVVN